MKETIQRYLPPAFFGALLLWGLWALFYYLGVDVHMSVLLKSEHQTWVKEACEGSGTFCQGVAAFFPFLLRSIQRLLPLFWFAGLSTIFYAMFLVWKYVREGNLRQGFVLTPFRVVLLFLAAIWCVYTAVSSGYVGETPVRRIVEPSPVMYQNVSEEGMQRLRENFDALQSEGCLVLQGQFDNGVNVYNMKTSCVQMSFFQRVMPGFLALLLFFFELIVFGHFLLSFLRWKPSSVLHEGMLSVGLGIGGWIAVLWLFALLGYFTEAVGWGLLIALPCIAFRSVVYWGRIFFQKKWTLRVSWYAPIILLGWLLMGYLALNFVNVIRPFPIGWDDLGSYMNRPRMLVSYGHFIYSMSTFQWEYLTSVGFLLFGIDAPLGAVSAMVINWSAGLFATLAVYIFARHFLGEGRGLIAALLYYTLPLVGHFSFADMKIDNAVFSMGVLATFCIFVYLFPVQLEDAEEQDFKPVSSWQWLVLAGIFASLAFGMKATAVMVIIALGATVAGTLVHWSLFGASFFLATGIFAKQGLFNISSISQRVTGNPAGISQSTFTVICLLIGVAIAVYGLLRYRDAFFRALKPIGIFAAAFTLTLLPWLSHNMIVAERVGLILGSPNTLTPMLQISEIEPDTVSGQSVRALPPDLRVDHTTEACQPTGHIEELDRYWGFENGWSHYLTLPWRTVMNLDSVGYYVTTTFGLLLFPLLLLVPMFWSKEKRWLRWVFAGTLLILYQWMFLANGVPWYGIGVFFGLVVGLEALLWYAPDKITTIIVGVFIGLSVLMNLNQRMWQFEQQRNLFEYPMGKVSASALRERTIPYYNDIAEVVSIRGATLPDRPFLYRIGTFIPYFIPRSLSVITATDHQLDLFNCLYQERDAALTTQRLKALGFNSIIFDTNTASIEQDPNGSLHQKVNAFLGYVNNPESGLSVVVQDTRAGVAFLLIP